MTEQHSQRVDAAQLTAVFRQVVAECNPTRLVEAKITARRDALVIGGKSYDLSSFEAIDVVGFGKAAAPMARAVEDALGERIRHGLVVAREGYAMPTRHIEVVEAAHPVPDERSVRAAGRIRDICESAGDRDLVVVLVSGGGSALLVEPAGDISLDDMQQTVDALVTSGADIRAINTVRKHLSAIKGGRLARAIHPATSVSLILSDVVSSDLSSIASGPTAPDDTRYRDALDVLERHHLRETVPESVLLHLERGAFGELDETPGRDDPSFDRCRHVLIGDTRTVANAARRACEERGWTTDTLATRLEGEAREVGRVVAAIGREMSGREHDQPTVQILAGETTVTVRGDGLGGRNQELALSAAISIEGVDGLLVGSFATDGTDGPTDAAGAIVDGRTYERIRDAGLEPREHLRDNDAYPALEAASALIQTGPTMTNLNDLIVIATK
jgi:hydroxypyruvate reductase